MTYRPLPQPPAQLDGETEPEYAARVLRFILDHRVTATLTDRQLEQAWKASQLAITQRYDHDDPADQTIISRLYAVRELITQARQHAAQTAPAPAGRTNAPQGGKSPGRPAQLLPVAPSGPGQPAYAEIDAALTRGRAQAADGIRF